MTIVREGQCPSRFLFYNREWIPGEALPRPYRKTKKF